MKNSVKTTYVKSYV